MTPKKPILKGKKRGGTQFPRIALHRAVQYAKKLVSKTHTGPQPATIILKGVFDSGGSIGKIRAAALKQYDLLQGKTSAYDATELAKQINSAPPNEQSPLLLKACLSPALFKNLFDTFQNDTVSRAKIKQQALALGVHPDSGDEAVNIFVTSLIDAALARETNGDIELSSSGLPALNEDLDETGHNDNPPESEDKDSGTPDDLEDTTNLLDHQHQKNPKKFIRPASRSQMQISLTLDSTMDPDKLQKSLDLLKRYGVI